MEIKFDRIVIFIFLILNSFSCVTKEEPSLIGSWIGCDENGNYRECHFWKNTTLTCVDGALEYSIPMFYTTLRDSIYYYNPNLAKHLPDRFLFNDSKLKLISSNGNIIHLIKISDFPLHPYNSKLIIDMPTAGRTHYEFMFSKRKAGYKCKPEKIPSFQIDTLDDNFEEAFSRK